LTGRRGIGGIARRVEALRGFDPPLQRCSMRGIEPIAHPHEQFIGTGGIATVEPCQDGGAEDTAARSARAAFSRSVSTGPSPTRAWARAAVMAAIPILSIRSLSL
jgi:hypothetical protein